MQDEAIWAGLEQTCVAGRFQVIPKEDTLKLLGDQENLALVLDGGNHITAFVTTFGRIIFAEILFQICSTYRELCSNVSKNPKDGFPI